MRFRVGHRQAPTVRPLELLLQTSLAPQLDENLGKDPARQTWVDYQNKTNYAPRISLYIMTFHVSTGRSASLKLQSNFSAATGSSVGS